MANTTNKVLQLPTVGGDSAVWGGELNNSVITPLDLMLGGIDAISLSAANYTLGATEIQNLVIKLSGTLLASVTVYTSCVGFFIVENNTTGAFTVTLQTVTTTNYPTSGVTVGSGIVVGQGSRNLFVADATVGLRRADTSLFTAGTTQAFYNASAPTGWTQITTANDYAMRVVSGAGGVAHAGSGFFGSATDGHAITISELAAHTHGVYDVGHSHTDTSGQGTIRIPGSGFSTATGLNTTSGTTGVSVTGITINGTGGGAAHSHTLAGLSVLDFIICSKA